MSQQNDGPKVSIFNGYIGQAYWKGGTGLWFCNKPESIWKSNNVQVIVIYSSQTNAILTEWNKLNSISSGNKIFFFQQIPLIFFQSHPIFVHGSLLFVPSVPHGFYMCFLVFAICFLSFSIVSQGIFLCFLICSTYLIISSKFSPDFSVFFTSLWRFSTYVSHLFVFFPRFFHGFRRSSAWSAALALLSYTTDVRGLGAALSACGRAEKWRWAVAPWRWDHHDL